jgi:hypothetical protein
MATITGLRSLSDVVTISNALETPVELAPQCQPEAEPAPTLMKSVVSFVALVAAVGGLLAACTSPASVDRPASPAPSVPVSPSDATPSPDPTKQAADAAIAAYRGFRQAEVRAEAKADPKGSGLERYAIDKALDGVYSLLLFYRQQGIVVRGAPTLSPTVTSVELGTPARAVITDCFDTSKWEAVYKATGKSAVAPGQARRTVVMAGVEVYRGRWMVRTVTNQRDRTC